MNSADKQALLELARGTMISVLGDRPPPAYPVRFGKVPPYGGLFVSLHAGRALRGCIGTFSPRESLEETVRAMSVSVLNDPRFVSKPVTLEELTSLEIEISVLSIPVPTDDPMSLETGRHGVIVEKDGKSGCFLPQVAVQLGWSVERLLEECCVQKAHLPSGAWREPGTRVLLFTAESFSDSTEKS